MLIRFSTGHLIYKWKLIDKHTIEQFEPAAEMIGIAQIQLDTVVSQYEQIREHALLGYKLNKRLLITLMNKNARDPKITKAAEKQLKK
ncbi:MAG: hypothetical protein EZS28_035948 [Streblomastix strix]|uniref:Uncharacterized protein n=1 Tax=Streblomastix strix TaxID=222440 RepID=A0A5J4UG80_9EUKA|nr:MAG: hypothetical protein EZS28_035948 [Streblomastix strix]